MSAKSDQRQSRRLWIGALAAVALLAFGVGVLLGRRAGPDADDVPAKTQRPAAAAAAVSGAPSVTLDADDLARSGIRTSVLSAASGAEPSQAFAQVVDVGPLTDLDNNAANARAQVAAAEAKASASRSALERAQALYKDGQNMSLAELQAAQAVDRADQAAAASARSQLATVRFNAGQQFGPAVGQLGGPLVADLIARRKVLVQVSASPELAQAAPRAIDLQLDGGRTVSATLVSRATRVDPRLQAQSLFYVAPADPRLLTGMTLTATWRSSALARSVVVPRSAIVVWQGQSWAYQTSGKLAFQRVPVDTTAPRSDGYWVGNLPPGAQVATTGAQLLLSQETRPQAGATAGDND